MSDPAIYSALATLLVLSAGRERGFVRILVTGQAGVLVFCGALALIIQAAK